jgi:hypothetical protein
LSAISPDKWASFQACCLRSLFLQVAVFENGQRVSLNEPVPEWLAPLLA